MRGRLPVFAHSCQRIGAAEARWAHNPKVLRSKLRFAILSLLSRLAQMVERKNLEAARGRVSALLFIFFPFAWIETESEPKDSLCCHWHTSQRIGAAEARWAHNPKVLRSKLRFASIVPPSSVGRAQDS